MKKVFSTMMAIIMAMALMIPAFASEDEYTVEATGITAAPTIKVTMPRGMSIVLNPYKMSYTNQTLHLSNNQSTFMSPAVAIKNESNVALAMTVRGNLVASDNLKVVNASSSVQTGTTAGDKNVYAELRVEVDKSTDVASDGTSTVADTTKKVLSGSEANLWGGTGTGAVAALSLTACAVSNNATTPNYVWLQFAGDVNSNPKEPYTAEDTLGANLTFTFTPVAASTGSGGAGNGSGQ